MKHAKYWSENSVFDDKTRAEIKALIDRKDEKELTDRFYEDLEFGTGGLRGILGAGTNRMNIYNVKKATCAVAKYLKKTFPSDRELKVAISHDSRRFSREFAETTASVMAANGIKSLITKELRPVPMLSFMTKKYGCHAGICITASHNPPEYNGYKVYWTTGGQLVPPHDKGIIDVYKGIESYNDLPSIPYHEGIRSGMISEIGDQLDNDYLEKVQGLSLRKEGRDGFKIVYSPLHGSGLTPVTSALKRFGFEKVIIVPEQEKPDGNFPTVKSPNPEDKDALKLAVELAKKENADLVMGTDPDSDRLGIVAREKGQYIAFNGNQIGCLLIDYILCALKEQGRLPDNALVIKTIVTTDLQKEIAEYYGASIEDTLTGFKWICDLIENYESGRKKPYKKFICGGEESYGFLMDSFVRDKDAVISCAIAAEMTAYYKSKGLSLAGALDNIFKRHGIYMESLHTVTMPGMDGSIKIKEIMKKLQESPPRIIDGNNVVKLMDFQLSQELGWDGNKFKVINSITLPKSNVLQFILEDGTKVTARPSGTEPKIKFYFSVKEKVSANISDKELGERKEHCLKRIERIKETFVSMMH
ncbi:MAG: phospho-sugar mutase [Oligoflexales bacterium]|nr:phospho-sugar mutase [Oligoflexales bacterium]